MCATPVKLKDNPGVSSRLRVSLLVALVAVCRLTCLHIEI